MKPKFWTLSCKKIFINSIIVLMVFSVSVMAVVGGSLISSAKIYNGIYTSGNENSNNISLMINVYWGTEYIEDMLETLESHNVKATFFVGGTWAVKEAETLQKIVDMGHEIGNHGYYHADQGKLSAQKNYEEIANTHNLIKTLVGVEMNLFAPPSGSYNKKTVEIATELGYKTVMWTQGKDTIDWRDHDVDLIIKRATQNAKGGDFVLMHPTAETAQALEAIISTLQNQGFNLCTVSENIES